MIFLLLIFLLKICFTYLTDFTGMTLIFFWLRTFEGSGGPHNFPGCSLGAVMASNRLFWASVRYNNRTVVLSLFLFFIFSFCFKKMFAGADAGFELRFGRCRNALTIPAILSILIHQKKSSYFYSSTGRRAAAVIRAAGRRRVAPRTDGWGRPV